MATQMASWCRAGAAALVTAGLVSTSHGATALITAGSYDFGGMLVGQTAQFTTTITKQSGGVGGGGNGAIDFEVDASNNGLSVNPTSGNFGGGSQSPQNLTVTLLNNTNGSGLSGVKNWTVRTFVGSTTHDSMQVTASIFQAAAVTANTGGPPKAGGSALTLTHAAATDGGQRAAARVVSATLTGAPGWSVNDIPIGAVITENTFLSGTTVFDTFGKLNGAHKASFSVSLEHDDQTLLGAAADDLGGFTWNLRHVVTGNSGGGTARLFNGDAYDHHTTRQSGQNTTAALVDGAAGGTRDITVSFVDNDGQILSDIVQLTGTLTDVYVLQLSYNPALVTDNEEDLFLAWWDGDEWVNAVLGNSGGLPTFVLGAYDDDLTLGRYGVDTDNHVVWAVLDHNSDFAVALVPEPASLALALLGLTLIHSRPRRHKS